jgi:hypothetical protein
VQIRAAASIMTATKINDALVLLFMIEVCKIIVIYKEGTIVIVASLESGVIALFDYALRWIKCRLLEKPLKEGVSYHCFIHQSR